jgi:chromosomal replication initiation ATPase DnaA
MTARSVGALANADAIILDDADGLFAGSEAETSLFHLLNRLVGTRGRLLLTARTAPARWDLSLPDLSSRLNALPMALIGAPDDSLLSALLLKQFADRQLQVGDDEIRFLVARMERSFDAARRIVGAIDRRALAEGRPITIPLLRSLLPNED